MRTRRARIFAAGTSAAAALTLTACAGSAGSAGGGGGGEGYVYGASQEEIDAAIADLEPVEIVFQSPAPSPNSITAQSSTAYADQIENMSGGQISVEVVYGNPIAGEAELYDALVDGRIDITYANPQYEPEMFEGFDALTSITSQLPESPVVGELISVATLTEIAFNSEKIMSDFADQGVVPLVPVNPPGASLSFCNQPGNSLEDWQGRQVRVGSSAHSDLIESIGAVPVSLEYMETFEALQRNTIDCTMIVTSPALEAGYFDVAPHTQYTGEQAAPRSMGAMLAGSTVDQMPMAYQQIIFDSWEASHVTSVGLISETNMLGVEAANDAGGEVTAYSDEVLELIDENRQSTMQRVSESGVLGEDIETQMTETIAKWTGIVEELGYEDGGTWAELPEWFDPEEYDTQPYVDRLYEEVISQHRPS